MLRSVVWLWLLAFFSVTNAQFRGPCGFGPNASPCSTTSDSTLATSTTTIQRTKTKDATNVAQVTTLTSTVKAQEGGGGAATTTEDVGSQTPTAIGGATTLQAESSASPPLGESTDSPELQQAASSNGGLSSTEKIGIGVGVGVGAPLIIGGLVLLFLLRRKNKNRYGSANSSAAQLRDQPAMSSAAPALAGVSAMGRSESKHSIPRTPSQHSLENIPAPAQAAPPEPSIIPPSQHSLPQALSQHSIERAPSQRSAVSSPPEQENLMPAPPAYQDSPSPMEEYAEPVSPVSPVSPMGSRPPSPLHDHER